MILAHGCAGLRPRMCAAGRGAGLRRARAARRSEARERTRTFVAFAGQPAPVRLAWSPVPGAARYRARWSTGPNVLDFDLTQTAFERPETPGRAASAHGRRDRRRRDREPACRDASSTSSPSTAHAPGLQIAAAPAPAAFAVGARFSSPGLPCQLGSQRAAGRRSWRRSPVRSACAAAARRVSRRIEVPVVIAPVIVSGGARARSRATTTTKIHLTIASVGAIGDQLEVESRSAISISDLPSASPAVSTSRSPRARPRRRPA